MFYKILNTSVGDTNGIHAFGSLIESSLHKKTSWSQNRPWNNCLCKKPATKSKLLPRFTPYSDLSRRNSLWILSVAKFNCYSLIWVIRIHGNNSRIKYLRKRCIRPTTVKNPLVLKNHYRKIDKSLKAAKRIMFYYIRWELKVWSKFCIWFWHTILFTKTGRIL